jgi:hypothetical protein
MKAASVGVLDQNVAASGSGAFGKAAAVQASEILRKASAFFAQAELDPRPKR